MRLNAIQFMITDKIWLSKHEFIMRAEEYCGIANHPGLAEYKIENKKNRLSLKIDLLNSIGISKLKELAEDDENYSSLVWWQKKNLTYICTTLFGRCVIIEFCYKDYLVHVEEQRLTIFFNDETIEDSLRAEEANLIKRFCDSSDENMQNQILKCREILAKNIISNQIYVPSSGFQFEVSFNRH